MAVQTPKKSSSALPWPALVPLGHHAGKPPISLQKMVILVGSRHNAHLHLMSRHVSKAHALILSHGGSVYIRDLASREHVYVNGVRQREAWLKNGDLIKIGSFTFKFKAAPPKVAPDADAPAEQVDLEVEGAEAPLSVAEKVMLIGRRSTCDISLTEATVSTAHAVIFHVAGKRYVRDLGSRSGTFVNGKKVHQQELNPGDTIRIGETDLRYVLAGSGGHHIEPVMDDGHGRPGEVDELEHLVGTAPLDVAAEITPDELGAAGGVGADGDLDRDLYGMTPGSAAGAATEEHEDDELRPDDLIELDLTPERPAVSPVDGGPIGVDAAGDAGLSFTAPATTAAGDGRDVDAIDLSAGAHADVSPVAADDDLIPLDDEISPRGGWQGMSRADDTLAGELNSPLPVVESAGDEAGGVAPVAEQDALPALPVTEEGAGAGGESPAAADDDVVLVDWEAVAPEEPAGEPVMAGDEPAIAISDGEADLGTVTATPSAEEMGQATFDSAVAELPAAEEEAGRQSVTEAVRAEEGIASPFGVSADADEDAPVVGGGLPAVAPDAEDAFAKKGRAREERGGEARGDERAGRGRRGRKSKKAGGADDAATSDTASVTEGGTDAPVVGAVAAAGVVGAAVVAGKVLGEETNVLAAEQGAVTDLGGVAEGGAEVRVEGAADEVHLAAGGGDDLGLAPVDEAAAGVEESPIVVEGAADVESALDVTTDPIDVVETSLGASGTAAFEAELAAEGDAFEKALAETPVEGPDVAEAVAGDAELVLADTPWADEGPAGSAASEFDAPVELDLSGEEALSLGAGAAGDAAATDSAAAQQIDPSTETSGGEALGDLDLVTSDDEVRDPDEALAIALESAGTADGAERAGGDAAAIAELEGTVAGGGVVEWADEGVVPAAEGGGHGFEREQGGEVDLEVTADADVVAEDTRAASTDVTAGGIEPAALGVVTDEHVVGEHPVGEQGAGGRLSAQQFEANGEAVELDTPGIAEADAVLGGQAFVAEAEGDVAHDARESETEELDGQSFVAEAAAEDVKEVAAPPEPVAPATSTSTPPAGGRGGPGGGAGFTIGTDLSSFIGGMPLVLPDLPPAPSGFGQVQVSLAGAKAPWQQEKRPSFPMGQGLAQEVMDAAEGLRDVEDMDEEEAAAAAAAATDEGEAAGEESYADEGAPGDEWNVAAVLEDEDEPVATGTAPVQPAARAVPPAAPTKPVAAQADAKAADAKAGVSEPGAEVDADAFADDEQPLGVTADRGVVEQLAPGGAAEAGPGAKEGASGFEVDDDDGDFKDITIDELMFDDPSAEAEPSGSHGFDEGIAALEFADEPGSGSAVIDRSPPPTPAPAPVAHPPKGGSGAAAAAGAATAAAATAAAAAATKAKPGAKAAVAAPASKKEGAKGRPAPRSLTGAGAAADEGVFGKVTSGAAGKPFAGVGVREADVFATPSAAGEDDDGSGGFGSAAVAKGEAPLAKAAGRRQQPPQRAIVPPRVDAARAAAAPFGDGGDGGVAVARAAGRGGGGGGDARPKKGVAGRLTLIVLLMLVSMGLAVAGIHYFVKVKQTSVGELRFQNVGALTKRERDELRKEQAIYLLSPQVRMSARGYVQARNPNLPLGFLDASTDATERFGKSIRADWSEERPSTMTMKVEYSGTDPDDRVRVHALLVGLYGENAKKVDQWKKLQAEVEQLKKRVQEFEALRAKRDTLKRAAEGASTPDAIQQLEVAFAQADAAYDAATQALKEAQVELRRAEEQLPPSPGEALLKPGGGGGGGDDAAKGDAELVELQRALEGAAAKAADLKGTASAEADAKRKMLDQAVEMFQQTAAGVMRQNPQLASYVQAVQQLQERTHKLGGDLIEVQQQQHKRLSALKKDMDEQVQARRAQIWAADKRLADLRAQLDLANRKFNAARDQGFTEDSREVKDALAEIRDLTARTEARKQESGNDPIVTKVADGLQELIDITKERVEADRARIEKEIKDQEQAFAESGMIERLPQQQQAQAKALEERQRAIGELRKQYADALDRRTAESNSALRELESQVTAIRGKIDERKRIIAQEGAKNLTEQQEAERRANLERRQVAVRKAQEQVEAAQRVFAERSKALRNAKVAQNEAASSRQELEAVEQALASREEEARSDKRQLDERTDKLKKIVTAEEPKESDVRTAPGRDDRMLFSLGAVVGLAVLFFVFAVVNVAGGERRARAAGDADEFDGDGFDAGPMAIREIGGHEAEAGERARR